jgi:hypothetical protein
MKVRGPGSYKRHLIGNGQICTSIQTVANPAKRIKPALASYVNLFTQDNWRREELEASNGGRWVTPADDAPSPRCTPRGH